MGSVRPLPRAGQPVGRPGPRRRRGGSQGLRCQLRREGGAAIGRAACGGDRCLPADRGATGAAGLLCPASLRRRFHRFGNRQLLSNAERAGHDDRHPPDLLHARTQPDRRGGARSEARRTGGGTLAAVAARLAGVPAAPAFRRAGTPIARERSYRPQRLEPAVRRDDRRDARRGGGRGADRH